MDRRSFMAAAAASAVGVLMTSSRPDLPDRIDANDPFHKDYVVRLDGKPLWLCVEADRVQGWARCLKPAHGYTNFHKNAFPQSPLRYVKLRGVVTFAKDTKHNALLKAAERDSL